MKTPGCWAYDVGHLVSLRHDRRARTLTITVRRRCRPSLSRSGRLRARNLRGCLSPRARTGPPRAAFHAAQRLARRAALPEPARGGGLFHCSSFSICSICSIFSICSICSTCSICSICSIYLIYPSSLPFPRTAPPTARVIERIALSRTRRRLSPPLWPSRRPPARPPARRPPPAAPRRAAPDARRRRGPNCSRAPSRDAPRGVRWAGAACGGAEAAWARGRGLLGVGL